MNARKLLILSQILTISSFASLIGGIDDPQIAIDGAGNALALWEQRGSEMFSVQSVRYLAAEGWKTPNTISLGSANAFDPIAATNSSDDTIALFRQDTGGYIGIFASTSILGYSWNTPVQLSYTASDFAKVGIDESGKGVAIWQQSYGANGFCLFASFFIPGSGWSSATKISDYSRILMIPDMQTGKAGRTILAWICPSNTGSNFNTAIQAAFYSPSSGWSTPLFLSNIAYDAFSPAVGISDSNECLVAWQTVTEEGSQQISSASLSAEGVWGAPVAISNPSVAAFNPDLDMNASGQAVVVWETKQAGSLGVSAAVRTSDGTWSSEVGLATQYAAQPEVAINDSGKAVAIWTQSMGGYGVIKAAVYAAGTWGNATSLSSSSLNGANSEVRVNPDGTALVVWQSNTSPGSDIVVFSSRLGLGGTWSEPVQIN